MEGENEHATACAKPTAQANGVVASTTMIKLITNAKTSELCASTSKQSPLVATKLTGWLRDHIAASHIAGLEWIDEEAQMFKIPWKRASDRNFDGDEDSLLFWNYALYSGKNPFEGDLASHKKRLSDALFCNQDILEHKDLRVNNGAAPYRVFQFVQQKRRRRRGSSLGRKHKKKPFLLKKYKIGQGSSSINHMSGRKKAVSHGAAKPAIPEADCGSRVDYHPLMKLKYSYVRQAGDTCEQMMDLRGSMKGPPLLKCFFCARKLENNVQLMEHYEAHIARNQSFVSEIEDLTVCRRCCISLDTPHDLQTHLNEVHQLTASTSCLICLRNLGSEAGLLVHMKQTHVSGETPYTCEVCRFRTSQYRDLTAHYRQVHTRGQYVLCPYCLRAFRSNTNNAHYIIHLRKHLNKGVKPCDSCSLVFVSAADLISHRTTCHGIASVTTDKTGETTVEVVELCLNHNAEKKGSNQNGDDGMLTCLNVLPPRKDYVGLRLFIPTDICCIECDYPMSRMNHFIKHMMCPICRYGTNCSTAFAEHVLMSHGNKRTASDQRLLEKEWACACGFTTNLGNALASHLMECGSGTAYRGQKLRRYVTRAYPGNPDGIFRKSLSLLASRDPAGAAIITDAEGDATDGESRRIESVTDGYLAVVAGWRDRHSAGKQCRAMSHDPAPSVARQTDGRSFKRRRIKRLWSPRETRECAADDETHMRCENDAEHPDARPPQITADPAGGAIADRAITANHPRVNLPASLLHAAPAGGASADSPRFRGCCSANAAVRHDKCDFLSRVRLCSLPGVVSPARRPRGGDAWGGHPRKRVGVHRQAQGSEEEEGEGEGEGSCTDRWQTTRRHGGCVPAPLWGDAIRNIELGGGGGGVAGGATVLPYPEEELQLHARLAAVCYEAASGGARERGDAASGGARERGDAASGGARERGDAASGGARERGDAASGGARERGDAASGGARERGDEAAAARDIPSSPVVVEARRSSADDASGAVAPPCGDDDFDPELPRLVSAAAGGDDDDDDDGGGSDDGSEASMPVLSPATTYYHPPDDDDDRTDARSPSSGVAAMEAGRREEEEEKEKKREEEVSAVLQSLLAAVCNDTRGHTEVTSAGVALPPRQGGDIKQTLTSRDRDDAASAGPLPLRRGESYDLPPRGRRADEEEYDVEEESHDAVAAAANARGGLADNPCKVTGALLRSAFSRGPVTGAPCTVNDGGRASVTGAPCTVNDGGRASVTGAPCMVNDGGRASVTGAPCTVNDGGRASVTGAPCTVNDGGRASVTGAPCMVNDDGRASVTGAPCTVNDGGRARVGEPRRGDEICSHDVEASGGLDERSDGHIPRTSVASVILGSLLDRAACRMTASPQREVTRGSIGDGTGSVTTSPQSEMTRGSIGDGAGSVTTSPQSEMTRGSIGDGAESVTTSPQSEMTRGSIGDGVGSVTTSPQSKVTHLWVGVTAGHVTVSPQHEMTRGSVATAALENEGEERNLTRASLCVRERAEEAPGVVHAARDAGGAATTHDDAAAVADTMRRLVDAVAASLGSAASSDSSHHRHGNAAAASLGSAASSDSSHHRHGDAVAASVGSAASSDSSHHRHGDTVAALLGSAASSDSSHHRHGDATAASLGSAASSDSSHHRHGNAVTASLGSAASSDSSHHRHGEATVWGDALALADHGYSLPPPGSAASRRYAETKRSLRIIAREHSYAIVMDNEERHSWRAEEAEEAEEGEGEEGEFLPRVVAVYGADELQRLNSPLIELHRRRHHAESNDNDDEAPSPPPQANARQRTLAPVRDIAGVSLPAGVGDRQLVRLPLDMLRSVQAAREANQMITLLLVDKNTKTAQTVAVVADDPNRPVTVATRRAPAARAGRGVPTVLSCATPRGGSTTQAAPRELALKPGAPRGGRGDAVAAATTAGGGRGDAVAAATTAGGGRGDAVAAATTAGGGGESAARPARWKRTVYGAASRADPNYTTTFMRSVVDYVTSTRAKVDDAAATFNVPAPLLRSWLLPRGVPARPSSYARRRRGEESSSSCGGGRRSESPSPAAAAEGGDGKLANRSHYTTEFKITVARFASRRGRAKARKTFCVPSSTISRWLMMGFHRCRRSGEPEEEEGEELERKVCKREGEALESKVCNSDSSKAKIPDAKCQPPSATATRPIPIACEVNATAPSAAFRTRDRVSEILDPSDRKHASMQIRSDAVLVNAARLVRPVAPGVSVVSNNSAQNQAGAVTHFSIYVQPTNSGAIKNVVCPTVKSSIVENAVAATDTLKPNDKVQLLCIKNLRKSDRQDNANIAGSSGKKAVTIMTPISVKYKGQQMGNVNIKTLPVKRECVHQAPCGAMKMERSPSEAAVGDISRCSTKKHKLETHDPPKLPSPHETSQQQQPITNALTVTSKLEDARRRLRPLRCAAATPAPSPRVARKRTAMRGTVAAPGGAAAIGAKRRRTTSGGRDGSVAAATDDSAAAESFVVQKSSGLKLTLKMKKEEDGEGETPPPPPPRPEKQRRNRARKSFSWSVRIAAAKCAFYKGTAEAARTYGVNAGTLGDWVMTRLYEYDVADATWLENRRYTASQRSEVVQYATRRGVTRAVRKYKLPPGTVRGWIGMQQKLDREAGRGKTGQQPTQPETGQQPTQPTQPEDAATTTTPE